MSKNVSQIINSENTRFDVLGDVLDTLRFRGSIFFRSELASPWGMLLESANNPRFHISLTGRCVIGTGSSANAEVVQLNNMEIIMLPHGDMHWIADQPGRQLIPSKQAGIACELGKPLFQQGEITNKLICGMVHHEKGMQHPILSSLPSVLHFSTINPNDSIWMTIMLIEAELEQEDRHHASIVDRLTEVLFLQLLNHFVHEGNELNGFMAALGNSRINKILEFIHRAPQTPWTLELLAEKASMSRATLARQFHNTVGVPPLSYIANWRMMKAYSLLKYSTLSLEDIADQVGFATARTLSKAFQKKYSYTPSALRNKESQ